MTSNKINNLHYAGLCRYQAPVSFLTKNAKYLKSFKTGFFCVRVSSTGIPT
jgi:hypothetical protein